MTPATVPPGLNDVSSVEPGRTPVSTNPEPVYPVQDSRLADIVRFAESETLPEVPWLTRLTLEHPRLDTRSLTDTTRLGKRVTDVMGAATLLVLLSPIMLLTAALVRLTSPGPAIFRQTRVGLNLRRNSNDRRRRNEPRDPERRRRQRRQERTFGREFTLYKFRTMRTDAEKNGAQLAAENDPRVTPLGRLLRRARIDELPQLWNVLRGEMSLVGPRPERPEFIHDLSTEIPGYINRLGLKPGLTGIAQIVNGYDTGLASFRRKVAFDLLYLQNCCLLNDAKILLRTIRVVLTGSGAR